MKTRAGWLAFCLFSAVLVGSGSSTSAPAYACPVNPTGCRTNSDCDSLCGVGFGFCVQRPQNPCGKICLCA